jgi:hypothetical protein
MASTILTVSTVAWSLPSFRLEQIRIYLSKISTFFSLRPLRPVPHRTHFILDSDDGHAQYYASSVNSHMSASQQAGPTGYADPYPAWSAEKQIPISYEEIEDIFLDLTQKFGFQRDSMRNQVRTFRRFFECC